MDALDEILKFLTIDSRIDLKSISLQHILGLTGNAEGRKLLKQQRNVLNCLVTLTRHESLSLSKDASLALVNMSADEDCISSLLPEKSPEQEQDDTENNIVAVMLGHVMNPESQIADPACMILSNLTRSPATIENVVNLLEKSKLALEDLVMVFSRNGYNNKGANLHYLGPVFSNLSQSRTVRRFILDRNRCIIQRLLPFTEYEPSTIRRGGIVGALRNCCFEVEYHEWLLSPRIDILPRLLLPLAGPEELPEDEFEKLPPELQYLPDDKMREIDPDIRRMLLEALLQLCATKGARELMRSCAVYPILREYHKWEKDRAVLLACENVVDMLIRTEEEIGEENLKDIEVPPDLHEKFQKMDEDFVKD